MPARRYNRRVKSILARALYFFILVGIFGCDRTEKEASAPPPKEPARADPCQGTSSAPIAGLPGSAHGYCVDPRSDVRRYGVAEASPLDAVCIELFNGECELYKSYGLQGVKTLRYIAANGSSAEVSVVASSFRRSSGAFGFFTQRILGSDLPSQITVEPLDVEQGRAVLGLGMAIVWRGKSVVELTYVSSEETPSEIESRSPEILRPLSRAIAETLVGPKQPERDVLLVESLEPDALGVAVVTDGLLDVGGSGPGTIGYFSRGEIPHRVLVAERRDESGSSDLLRLLRRSGIEKKLKGREIVRVRRTRENALPETWYLLRNDEVVLGVGPLSSEEEPTQTTPKERERDQEKWEEFAIARLTDVARAEKAFTRSPEGEAATPSAE